MSTPELLVAKSRAERIAVGVGTVVIVSFTCLAVRGLFYRIAVVPSALWLLLVAFVTIQNIRESGLRAFIVGVLGAFSRRQVLVVDNSNGSAILHAGFKLFGVNVVEHRIRAEDVATIHYDKGQGSDLAGRDVNDWTVFLWYWHRDPRKEAAEKERGRRRAGQAVLAFGPPRAKIVTEALARRIGDFLNDSGIAVPVEPAAVRNES